MNLKSNEKLGIIGYGIVGGAVAHGFRDWHDIYIYDKYKKFETFEFVVENSDIIFICLPTPMKEDGSIDLSIIDESIEKIASICRDNNKIITIKSTVVPGTTRNYAKKYPNLNFCFNPEFLTEANYLEDFKNSDRNIVGADTSIVKRRVGALYTSCFPKTSLFLTDSTTAETVKYMANCLLASKVICANEFYDLCKSLNISYEEVKRMVSSDRRIGHSHLDVTSERGFGGKCFPKDISAIIKKASELNIDFSVLKNVWEKNLRIRKNKDWEKIPGAISSNNNFL